MAEINIRNKKAWHDYEFLERYTAGMQLTGTEIKSIRAGKASLVDAYCYFSENELWVKGMHISEYDFGNLNNHDPKRDRKLLLNRKELKKLAKNVKEKGLTIIALRIFLAENGYAKLEIALAKGKKEYDKREDLKKKDSKRELDRMMKR
jgi:SsrA-binding protein